MCDNKKAPTGAGTPARAGEAGGEYMNNLNTNRPTCQIVDYLSTGRENAHTAREIADWIGCTPRDISRAIERARLQGAPICATCNAERPGYYIANNAEELADYLRRFKCRRRTIARTETALMTTLCTLTGQQVMDLKGGGV